MVGMRALVRRSSSRALGRSCGILCLVALVGLCGSLGAQARLGELRAQSPVQCSGADDIVLDGVEIVAQGDAVTVTASCNVTIRNSRIVSDQAAIRVSGSGNVLIDNSVLEGGDVAIHAAGSSSAVYKSSEIYGGVRITGSATVNEDGNNVIADAAPARPGGDNVISIDASGVSVGDVRVDAGGVSVGDVEVRAGAGGATIVAGGVKLRTDGGAVRIDTPGSTVEIDPSWRVANRGAYAAADTDRLLVELNAQREGDRVTLDLAGDILFDFDSAEIRADAAAELAKVAHVLRQKAADQILLVGHTDSVGKDDYNQRLSLERAAVVMNWLYEREGIPAALMSAKGLGSSQPVAHNTRPDGSDDPQGRAKNRRVEIEFGVQ